MILDIGQLTSYEIRLANFKAVAEYCGVTRFYLVALDLHVKKYGYNIQSIVYNNFCSETKTFYPEVYFGITPIPPVTTEQLVLLAADEVKYLKSISPACAELLTYSK